MPSAPRLLFVRHAQSTSNVLRLLDSNAPGPDLSELGRSQATTLARSLEGVALSRLYASTLVRTQQTAAPLAAARGLPVSILDGLREVESGDLEMRSDHVSVARYIEVVMRWARKGDADLAERIPGGPDGHTFFRRYDAAVAEIERELQATSAPQTAAVFGHGAAIRVWVGARCANLPGSYAADHELHNTGTILVEKANDGSWQLIEWNAGEGVNPYTIDLPDPAGETLAEATDALEKT